MNTKLIKLVAIATSVAPLALFAAETHNWVGADGQPVRNVSGNCYRDASWTPATAAPGCDGALPAPAPVTEVKPVAAAPVAAPAPAPAPMASPVVAPAEPKAVAVAAPAQRVTFKVDALFDFDKAVLKTDGKHALDDFVTKLHDVTYGQLAVVGHTDAIGTKAYNQALSLKRANAVKQYLQTHGIDAAKLTSEGKGATEPVASNKTAQGRAKNRRVEINISGEKK